MDAAKAEEIQRAISSRFPEVDVAVTPYDDGAEIRVSREGDQDRKFKIDDDDLNSPLLRMLVGAVIN
jgi:hypothetical protein